ncbi:VPS35 endosomal protein-sorting factor-like isoform X1 [Dreissena polymorpha]|uniref:VPS35 endosomal protein-sorting factor-like isoform X1 n=1 Tax=Dreissena polymorpha TaxID=45954 RepID=UPI0022645E4A|nr:VPS35 endosomal protein-sorting factor-like isoform X1 [Dreissena polymorpha]
MSSTGSFDSLFLRFPRKRNYELERDTERLPTADTDNHPLKAITVSEVKNVDKKGVSSKKPAKASQGSKSSSLVADPLSMMDPLSAMGPLGEGLDPLSAMAAEASAPAAAVRTYSFAEEGSKPRTVSMDDSFEPWSAKKADILARYTTSEKLSITTSFLSATDKEQVAIKTQTSNTMSDKVRNRLEQLDDFEEGSVQEMLNLSQQEYVSRIEDLNQHLVQAWDQDQRVKALKIAIQCAKLLADVSVIQFYPSKFVLITDILDTFGKLVYERLRDKAQYYPPGSGVPIKLPENFTPQQVPDSAKETCRNWFFKIASIRELIPRFYVEAAIMKCYSFLNPGEYADALQRLSVMIRGVGDPLVALYAKCFLSRVGMAVAPSIRDHLSPMFEDFLATFPQVSGDSVQNTLAIQKLEMPRYLTLFSPGLDWLLQCIANKASDESLTDILHKSRQQCNSALLLNSLISAFKPQYIASRVMEFIEMIKECEETGFPKHVLFRTLGTCLAIADPPEDKKLAVLNEVWKPIMKLKNPVDYIACAEAWMEFIVKHFGKREVNTVLTDVIKHMTPDRAFEEFYPQLQSIVAKILVHIHDFSTLFALEKFLPFIDMFQKESVRVDVCKTIAEAFSRYQVTGTNDPVIINAMMFICKTMHDSVNAMTLEDEKKVISNLISGFVLKISFGREFEQQLSFFVESRAAFTNLDIVLVQLIQSVNNLSIETRKVVGGNHSRKTGNFVRACAAYCFITIPSLQSVFAQLQLYLLSGQVALLNQCYSQGDAFFKAAISLLPEIPRTMETVESKHRSSEPLLVDFISNFVSTLLVVPDNPDSSVVYLLRGLLNILQNYTWEPLSDAKVVVYTRVLAMLSASCQESYPYHVNKVDSNDSLYGSDPKYVSEVVGICSTLVDEILGHLKSLTNPENEKRQTQLSLELFHTLVAHGDVSQDKLLALAVKLWSLAQRNHQADQKQMKRIQAFVRLKAATPSGHAYKELLSRIPLETTT